MPLPQSGVKQLEFHSLWMKTPRGEIRKIKGGGEALPRPHICPSLSQETSLTTHTQKGSLEVKGGVMSRDALPIHLCDRNQEMAAHAWQDPET